MAGYGSSSEESHHSVEDPRWLESTSFRSFDVLGFRPQTTAVALAFSGHHRTDIVAWSIVGYESHSLKDPIVKRPF